MRYLHRIPMAKPDVVAVMKAEGLPLIRSVRRAMAASEQIVVHSNKADRTEAVLFTNHKFRTETDSPGFTGRPFCVIYVLNPPPSLSIHRGIWLRCASGRLKRGYSSIGR
jgi:hypothetical protein